jgi:methionyl-tRNA formyltransferase
MSIKIVFMGTPDFSVPALLELHDHFQITGVITQPDRKAGRGQAIRMSPVKSAALDLGLDLFQPRTLSQTTAQLIKTNCSPDLIVVVAYGNLLPPAILDLPPHGCLNVHASLLPRWRGASPINAAILHGDDQSGVTIMKMDQGLDTGPILAMQEIPLSEEETGGSLFEKCSRLGGQLLIETIPPYLAGKITPRPQNEAEATYAPLLTREDGELDFSRPAESLSRQVRAYNPWPGSFFFQDKQRLIIHKAHAESVTTPGAGVLLIYNGFPAVGTSRGILVLDVIQIPGRKKLPGNKYLHGARNWNQASTP